MRNLFSLYHTIPYHTFYDMATPFAIPYLTILSKTLQHPLPYQGGATARWISFAAKVSRVNSFLDQFLGSLAHLIKSSDFELKGPLDNSDTVYCT